METTEPVQNILNTPATSVTLVSNGNDAWITMKKS
jgi:hypothetical protein